MNTDLRVERIVEEFFNMALTKGRFFLTITIKENKIRNMWCLNNQSIMYTKWFGNNDSYEHIFAIIYKNMSFPDKIIANELLEREIKMQNYVLPEIEKLLKEQIQPDISLCNKTFTLFFLQNMHKIIPSEKGLSSNENIKAIQLMARFHAASVALLEKQPELVETFKITNSFEKSDHVISLFNESKQKALSFIETVYPIIASKFKSFKDITMRHIIDLYNYDSEEFCVLNHGDFSICNLLFHDDDTSIRLLMNYPMVVYSSPAIDLLHFLNTSPSVNIIYDQDEELLEIYLKELRKTMKLLNCTTKPLTMKKLQTAILKRTLYAVFASITFKLNTMIKEEGKLIVSDSEYKELVEKVLLVMHYKHYFDYVNKPQSSPV